VKLRNIARGFPPGADNDPVVRYLSQPIRTARIALTNRGRPVSRQARRGLISALAQHDNIALDLLLETGTP
jgi:hypothetical protein